MMPDHAEGDGRGLPPPTNIISEAAYRGFLVEFTSNLGANIAAQATNAMNIKRAASAVGKIRS